MTIDGQPQIIWLLTGADDALAVVSDEDLHKLYEPVGIPDAEQPVLSVVPDQTSETPAEQPVSGLLPELVSDGGEQPAEGQIPTN